MRKMAGILIAMLCFPWLVSLAWSGAAKGNGPEETQQVEESQPEENQPEENQQEEASAEASAVNAGAPGGGEERGERRGAEENGEREGAEYANTERRVLVKRDGIQTYISLEDYLPGVIVCQISQQYRPEALKCQAVIARTYIYRLMEGRSEIWEEELDLDYLSENQLNVPWDKEKTAQYLEQCRQAVAETAGVTMQYEGREILPLFHAVSAGRTRTGDENYPYLQSVESRWDTGQEDYLRTMEWNLPAFAGLINEIPDAVAVAAEQLPAQLQIVKKDDAGYVMQMKAGAKTYSGEEIQYALGLPSSCFSLEGDNEAIRAIVKGIGHGYGLSQAGADAMAGEGWGYQDILNYYYKNISLISE